MLSTQSDMPYRKSNTGKIRYYDYIHYLLHILFLCAFETRKENSMMMMKPASSMRMQITKQNLVWVMINS